MAAVPLAYLLTWTTYGTWLQGDDRGSVSDAHNKRGEPFVEPSKELYEASLRQMTQEAVLLYKAQRLAVHETILDHCKLRGWNPLAVNARTNHAHAVVTGDAPPEKMTNQFKAWATRRMRQDHLIEPQGRVWTKGCSTRYLEHPH